jgi:hypothetical protein
MNNSFRCLFALGIMIYPYKGDHAYILFNEYTFFIYVHVTINFNLI